MKREMGLFVGRGGILFKNTDTDGQTIRIIFEDLWTLNQNFILEMFSTSGLVKTFAL